VNGSAPAVLSAPIGIADTFISCPNVVEARTLLQVDQEILCVTGASNAGTLTVTRGAHGTTAATHQQNAPVYLLSQKVVIAPFVKNFFGTPASGDWQSTVQIPNVRIASVGLYMTNALGDGAVAFNPYTNTIDNGLRTMSGGQYTFQIGGYLAIQSGAAPDIVVDATRSVRDIYAVVRSAPQGSALTLQISHNRQGYAALTVPVGATISNVVSGFGLPPLLAGDSLSLDVVSVGITTPGSDLNVIIRL
jgi:hypothetical protein